MALYTGLEGAAKDFAMGLSQEVWHDFQKLAQKLQERFPFRGRIVNQTELFMKIMDLKQGSRTFDEYVNLLHSADSGYTDLIIDRWLAGLHRA